MLPSNGKTDRRRRPRVTVAEMDQWRAAIRDLPPVRTERIRRSRARIQMSAYEDDLIADATAERMREELGL